MVNIPLRARNLIRKLDTTDPYLIAKELRISIIETKVPSHIQGFWRRILRRKIIFIDQSISEYWQIKAVIAHELGHILLHPQYKSYCMAGRSYYVSTKREKEANAFAIELLSYSSDIEKQYINDFLENGYKIRPKNR